MPDTERRRRSSANPLSQVLGPFARTGGFSARSWGTYLDRQSDELPVARPTIALAAQAFRDEIVLAGFSLLRSAPEQLSRSVDRWVQQAIVNYNYSGCRQRFGQSWANFAVRLFRNASIPSRPSAVSAHAAMSRPSISICSSRPLPNVIIRSFFTAELEAFAAAAI